MAATVRSSRERGRVPGARLRELLSQVGDKRGRVGPLEQDRGIKLHAEPLLERFGEIEQNDRIEAQVEEGRLRASVLPAAGEMRANELGDESQHRIAIARC